MLKMIIRMDDNKIKIEKKYCLDGIYQTLDSTFAKMGFVICELYEQEDLF